MDNQLEKNIELFCHNAIDDALLKLKENNKSYVNLINNLDSIEKEFNGFLSEDEKDEKIKTLKEYIWQSYKKTLLEMNAVYLKGIRDGIALKGKFFE